MRFLLVLFALLLSGVANAQAPVMSYEPSLSYWEAACAKAVADSNGAYTSSGTRTIDAGQPGEYKQIIFAWPGNWLVCQDVYKKASCPPISPATAWTAPDTSKPSAQQCADQPSPTTPPAESKCTAKSGKTTGKVYLELLNDIRLKSSYCNGGCQVGPGPGGYSADDVIYTKLGNGVRKYYLYADFQYSGGECKSSDRDSGPVKRDSTGKPGFNSDGTNPPPCPAGYILRYLNNVPVCSDASGTSWTSSTKSNPDNAVDSNENVTPGTPQSPAEGSLSKFCQDHPASPICSARADNADGETGIGNKTDGTGTDTSGTGTGTSGTGTGTGTGSGTVNCPGCATEETLNRVKGLLDPTGVNGDVSGGKDSAGDAFGPVLKGISDLTGANAPFASTTWSFPSVFPESSECVSLRVAMNGRLKQEANIDYCAMLALARSVLGWVVYVFTLIIVFNIATGKKASTSGKD